MTSSRFQSPVTAGLRSDDELTPEGRGQRDYLRIGRDADARVEAEMPPKSETLTDALTAVEQTSADGEWVARWVIADQGGAPIARSLTVEPTGRATPAGGVTSRLLRELSPSVAVSTPVPDPSGDPFWQIMEKHHRGKVDRDGPAPAAPTTRTAGRPALSDEVLARVAVAYLEELPRGKGLLARMGARPEIDRPTQTVRDWVRIARRRGFLSEAGAPGRKGAMPGPALKTYTEALAAAEDRSSRDDRTNR